MKNHIHDLEFDMGPDRDLPCGCRIINGVLCMVSRGTIDPEVARKLYDRPGRFIAVEPDHDPGTEG